MASEYPSPDKSKDEQLEQPDTQPHSSNVLRSPNASPSSTLTDPAYIDNLLHDHQNIVEYLQGHAADINNWDRILGGWRQQAMCAKNMVPVIKALIEKVSQLEKDSSKAKSLGRERREELEGVVVRLQKRNKYLRAALTDQEPVSDNDEAKYALQVNPLLSFQNGIARLRGRGDIR